MNSKKALRRFLEYISSAPAGARFEVGTTWDEKNGWRVYQRVGDKGLAMRSQTARDLHASYERLAKLPAHRTGGDELRPVFAELLPCADDCDRRNAAGAIPDELLDAIVPAGRA